VKGLPPTVAALFDRRVPEPEALETVVGPREDPHAVLLQLLGASSFEQLEQDAEERARAGKAPGRILVRKDVLGRIIDARRRTYGTLIEAAIDVALQSLEERVEEAERLLAQRRGEDDPGAAEAALDEERGRLTEARRLSPLASRWRIRRDLAALGDTAPAERAPGPPERPAARRESVPSEVPAVGFDANLRGLNSARAAVLHDRRDAAVARFDDRQELKARMLQVPDVASVEHATLAAALRRWDTEHPELAEEVAGCG
jgi:hypothetical protein